MQQTLTCLLPLLFVALSPVSAAQDVESPGWPRWRGPNRDGVSREVAWSSEGAAEPLWRAEVGPGYSNMAIAGGRLYTLGHDVENAKDTVLCLDPATGAELWSYATPQPLMDQYHGGGANSTPTVVGDTLFVAGRSGRCFALDAETGDVRWERDYGTEFELTPAMYGYSGSPVVEGDVVYLALGRTVFAVNASDGEVRWNTEIGEREGYATPVPFVLDGKPVLATLSGAELVVLAAATGEVVVRYPWSGEAGAVNASTPIIAGDDVFLSSAYGAGASRVQLGDVEEPQLVWHSRRMRNKVSGCTLFEGHVYGFDESMLKCLAFEDGAEKWRVRGLGMGSVAVAGGRLIVISSQGELIVAEASPEGFEELSRRQVLEGGVYWTTPVLLDGLIYVRSSLGSIACLDHRPTSVALADAGATEEADAVSLPAGAALFRAHAEKIGGGTLMEKKSLHLDGAYESTAEGITRTGATFDRTADGRWRLAWDLGEYGTAQRASDGQVAWQDDPFYGTFLFEEERLREVQETKHLLAAVNWHGLTTEQETLGRVRFEGSDCWAVRVLSANGAERTYFFDVETGLLSGHDAENEAMAVFADYTDFDGVLLPVRTTYLMSDTGAEEIFWIEEASWDSVDDALFAPPVAVQRLLRSPEEKAAEKERLTAAHGHLFGTYRSEGGPSREFRVEEGSLVILTGDQSSTLQEADAEGRFHLESMPSIYLAFELDDNGQGIVMRIEGIPEQEPMVCPRVAE